MLSLPDSCICSFTLARKIHKLKQFGNLRLMSSVPLSTLTKVNPLGSVEEYLHEFFGYTVQVAKYHSNVCNVI